MSIESLTYSKLMNRLSNAADRADRLYEGGTLTEAEKNKIDRRIGLEISRLERDGFLEGGLSDAERKAHRGSIGQIFRTLREDGATVERGDQAQDRAKDQLGTRIRRAERAGLITPEEAEKLEKRLTGTDQLKGLDRSKALDKLGTTLGHLSRDGNTDRAKQSENFEARIAAGLRDGSLTEGEAKRLRKEVGKLSSLDGEADPVGTRAAYAQLSRQIWGERHDPGVDLDQRRGAILEKLADKLERGQINFDTYVRFAFGLDRLWNAYTDPNVNDEVQRGLGARLNTLFQGVERL